MNLKRFTRGPILWITVVVLLVLVFTSFARGNGGYKKTETSNVIAAGTEHKVKKAQVLDKEQRIEIERTDGTQQQAAFVAREGDEITALLNDNPPAEGWDVKVSRDNVLVQLLFSLLPIAIVVLLLFFFMNQMQGGGSRVMNFGKSKAKLVSKDTPKTTFADVA